MRTDTQIVEHTTKSSNSFDDSIDTTHILYKLDSHLETLSNNPSKKDIERVQSDLKSMEVITISQDDQRWWINEALVLHKYVMRRPLRERISYLFKSYGVWKSEHTKEDNLEVKSRIQLPMMVTLQPDAEDVLKEVSDKTLLLSIQGLRSAIEGMIQNGDSSCGVFPKPYGVIHMNRLRMWIEDNETLGYWDVKDDLSTMSLYEIATTAVFKTTNEAKDQ
ncbi:hypothetical protein HXA34_19990 [Salipaludibacillus agaradhaerens]|jgi:hypothetical protein|uniref:hypothetical protein n=1 Tax=Salipaludibacillus agaradhaerens TaxID=76935 RepID=UPI002150DD3B|nr:hypothetical protein [Salipaludibacillus agaradhaerens]MCR6108572.1 hypothetical protein [Salipaludibacillus agaradhaerens]MCR6120601.1 hypothetical protein [Salipaludibacillus agaradhaerens]